MSTVVPAATIDDVVNIAAHLPAMARRQPNRLAVIAPTGRRSTGRRSNGRRSYVHFTFEQLDRDSDDIAAGLRQLGVSRGVRTALMVTPSLSFFSLTFALFKVGAAPVLIDPGIGVKNMGRCLAEAEPEAFIGVPKAQFARWLLRWGTKTLRRWITVGSPHWPGSISLDGVRAMGRSGRPFEMARTAADETAAILFTSGSTGPPKGAVYSHGNFAAQVDAIRDRYDIRPGEIDLPTFPLFALFAPALGMTAVIPDMDPTRPALVDPETIIEAIDDWGVTTMFGSPALLKRVGAHAAAKGVRFPSLRRVISAGAPVGANVLETFQSLLSDDAEIVTPYGATESLPVASIGSREILRETREKTALGAGVCVGRPVSPMRVRIIPIDDAPIDAWRDDLELPKGSIGEIVVQGPVVTRSYYNRPEATRLAKITDPVNGDLYHRMGDLGYFDDEGRLWFCGRKSQRVDVGGKRWLTIPCEAIFNNHPAVARTALIGLSREGRLEPALCVERAPASAISDADLIHELRAMGERREHTREIRTIFIYPGTFPVDIRHNAKIFREKLALWARDRRA